MQGRGGEGVEGGERIVREIPVQRPIPPLTVSGQEVFQGEFPGEFLAPLLGVLLQSRGVWSRMEDSPGASAHRSHLWIETGCPGCHHCFGVSVTGKRGRTKGALA